MDLITSGTWTTYDADGNLVTVEDMYFGQDRPWHAKGFYDGRARRVIDVATEMGMPEVFFIIPQFVAPSGATFQAQYAMIARDMGDGEQPFIYPGTVKVGDIDKFLAMNKDKVRPTKSPFYNLVTPRDFVTAIDEEIRQPDGSHVETVSMGFLGAHGAKGLFIVIKMPDYQIAGQEVKGYMTCWNPVQRGNTIHILNSDVCVVCNNTLRMAVAGAHRMLRIPHTVNADEMMRGAMREIFPQAMLAQRAGKEAGDFMAEVLYTDEQFDGLLNRVFKMPRRPDTRRLTKTDADTRIAAFESKMEDVSALRLWAKDVRSNAWEISGVTDDNAQTAWGAYQAMTFVASHMPAKNPKSVWTAELLGVRGQIATEAFVGIMHDIAPDVQTAAISMSAA